MTQKTTSPWPEGCQGAISLSFDDARPSQPEIAIPILEEYGLLGTFYIKPNGDDWKQRYAPWHEIGLAGHEIGNHTISHLCSRNFAWGKQPRSLETVTLDEIEADIVEAERRIKEVIPEQPVRTFCYPCYQNHVGEGPTRQSYVPIVAKYFPAARGIGEAANNPLYTDLHYLSCSPVAGWMSGKDLCGFAESAIEKERWCILTFHSLQHEPGGEWMPGGAYHGSPLPADNFRELCQYLDANKDRIWTAPVLEITDRIIEWRKGMER